MTDTITDKTDHLSAITHHTDRLRHHRLRFIAETLERELPCRPVGTLTVAWVVGNASGLPLPTDLTVELRVGETITYGEDTLQLLQLFPCWEDLLSVLEEDFEAGEPEGRLRFDIPAPLTLPAELAPAPLHPQQLALLRSAALTLDPEEDDPDLGSRFDPQTGAFILDGGASCGGVAGTVASAVHDALLGAAPDEAGLASATRQVSRDLRGYAEDLLRVARVLEVEYVIRPGHDQ